MAAMDAVQKRVPTELPSGDLSRAVLELGLWSAAIDGDLSRAELDELAGALRAIPGLSHTSVELLGAMLDEMQSRFTTDDAASRRVTALARAITEPELRRWSYQLAVIFAASDGELSEAEDEFLDGLQEMFGLSDDEAQAIEDDVVDLAFPSAN